MPKKTKAMLESEIDMLTRMLDSEIRARCLIQREIDFLQKHSTAGQIPAMITALERITDALAHVVARLSKEGDH